MQELAIDILSDVVCPWCFIGLRRLDLALGAFPEVAPKIVFRPFELDPGTPAEGVDLRAHLQKKYGGDPEAMFRRVEIAAAESGITLDFARVQRFANTLAAHTLLRHAIAKGTQRALAGALFEAYFLGGRDIGDVEVLADVAAQHGFEREAAAAVCRDERELKKTRAEAADALASGVRGVPFVIFDDRFGISGAQSPGVFRDAIARALGIAAPAVS